MPKQLTLIVIYILVIMLSVMYATQPLQPLLAREFGVSITMASYFTAIILFWLGVAPIIYGYILEGISAKKILLFALSVLFVTNIGLSFSGNFEMFFAMRFIEGLAAPAIMTACMSILAKNDPQNVRFNMNLYVAATVFGGLIGRVMSGLVASMLNWQLVFLSLSLGIAFAIYFIAKQNFAYETDLARASFKDIKAIFTTPSLVLIYALMFVMFFVFAGLLNVLPFRIKDLFPNTSEASIGALYLGYGSGIVVSLFSKKISHFLGGDFNTIMFGGGFFTLIVAFFIFDNMWVIFTLMFLLCVGMFSVHSVSSGLANSIYTSKKSLTSGIYLTFYYMGGTLGAIIPSIIYENFSQTILIVLFVIMLVGIYTLLFINRHHYKET